jgi:hypothetical protein
MEESLEMISRYIYGALVAAILVASASMTTFAQVAELRGKVLMQQADGQKVPLAGAVIDVFRTDMQAKYDTKTDKKGEFVFAGLPFIGTYTVVASHPTARPNFVPGVRVGQGNVIEVVVTPGDGKRPTYEEVRQQVVVHRIRLPPPRRLARARLTKPSAKS